jgi:hypothetical protein
MDFAFGLGRSNSNRLATEDWRGHFSDVDVFGSRDQSGLEAGDGGERGIRTPDTVSRIPVFKTGAFNHSAISPATTVLLQSAGFSRSGARLLALIHLVSKGSFHRAGPSSWTVLTATTRF